jgi:formiminotetrahydrofolate cyclodeaminase
MRANQNIHPYQEACLQVPMLLAREVLVLMDDFNAMSPYIVKSIVGDLEMGLILATAVLKGCVVNMKINLQGLNNQALLAESLALIQKIEQISK